MPRGFTARLTLVFQIYIIWMRIITLEHNYTVSFLEFHLFKQKTNHDSNNNNNDNQISANTKLAQK